MSETAAERANERSEGGDMERGYNHSGRFTHITHQTCTGQALIPNSSPLIISIKSDGCFSSDLKSLIS